MENNVENKEDINTLQEKECRDKDDNMPLTDKDGNSRLNIEEQHLNHLTDISEQGIEWNSYLRGSYQLTKTIFKDKIREVRKPLLENTRR